jgi:hypothetical protein
MLLTKLKAFVAVAFAVAISVAAVGLTYGPGAAQSPPAPKVGRPLADELEELRLEVAALRKGLEVTRERVKALEAEAQARKGGATPAPAGADADKANRALEDLLREKPAGADADKANRALEDLLREKPDLDAARRKAAVDAAQRDVRYRHLLADGDPLADAEVALKKLRQNPKDQQAADALERAVQQLNQQLKKPSKPDGNEKR